MKHAALAFALLAATAGSVHAQNPTACDSREALKTDVTGIDADGVIRISDGYRLRLANIVWPDHLEPGLRAALREQIEFALKGQIVTWKPAAGPDRWGVAPAHLFVQEPDAAREPFWLQAGLVEAGLVPAWPEPAGSSCWNLLISHEKAAIRARKGYWAPRAQAARHRAIETSSTAHAGRRIVALWKVRNIRRWRSLVFVNMTPSFRGGPSLALTGRQVRALGDAGHDVFSWQGKWSVARFVIGANGLTRLRIETHQHIGPLD